MPSYEMPLLLRIMKKPELVATLKRTSETIFNTGGIIRKIENWGVTELPYKISIHNHLHSEANHFCIWFDAPPRLIEHIVDEGRRDIDIIRIKVYNHLKPPKTECTLHEEMLPPPYRPSVQKLMEIAEKQHRNRYAFKYNSGLNYYPFCK
ncbi:probable 28S ribosomal protein S6, mitochondrial [Harpegnathos saltator]|uniref:Small ribosomal subunit protein bS6m n=1 Tax=Harpegnathos saltator TaxID=610380 RepID=E2B8D3_HARSA|nr:probable 28S ribosomal protein S6, mitochondrial [Harpegnathos saltator]EFN88032.1 Probable 28S ribosomal protein S6, mitochondrial [Harpegnathos saltator]